MQHFFDPLQVQVEAVEQRVVLSLRVTDTKVDEHHIGLPTFRVMVTAYKERTGEWCGPAELRVRLDTSRQLVSLIIGPRRVKREVYRFGQSHFEVMVAQFMSQDRD